MIVKLELPPVETKRSGGVRRSRSSRATQGVSIKADFVGLSPRLLSIGLSP
jgi:hypothetical protein